MKYLSIEQKWNKTVWYCTSYLVSSSRSRLPFFFVILAIYTSKWGVALTVWVFEYPAVKQINIYRKLYKVYKYIIIIIIRDPQLYVLL